MADVTQTINTEVIPKGAIQFKSPFLEGSGEFHIDEGRTKTIEIGSQIQQGYPITERFSVRIKNPESSKIARAQLFSKKPDHDMSLGPDIRGPSHEIQPFIDDDGTTHLHLVVTAGSTIDKLNDDIEIIAYQPDR